MSADESVCVELEGAALEKAFQEALAAEAAASGQEVTRAGDNLLVPREGWDRFKRGKIWVKNDTEDEIRVYVTPVKSLAELLELGNKLAGSATGGSFETNLKLQRRLGRVQTEVLTAQGPSMQMFELGSAGGDGGYVTAEVHSSPGMLVCRDRHVKSGWCLFLRSKPFLDEDFTRKEPQPAVQAAPTAP